jgi:hypothetical protein
MEVRGDVALQVVMASGWRDRAASGCMCGAAHDYKCRRCQAGGAEWLGAVGYRDSAPSWRGGVARGWRSRGTGEAGSAAPRNLARRHVSRLSSWCGSRRRQR